MKTPSLLKHFEAPEHYLGRFGWLCGYSADCHFLDQAAERFTQQTPPQRAHQGQIALAVMLDPGHGAIALTNAPGVAHLLFKPEQNKPFSLLHAKVAVLGFRHETDPQRWLLRLIVSTGNWTVQTLTESLDLAVCIECSSEDLQQNPDWLKHNCSDINAAWQMLAWLRQYFDTRILNAKSTQQSQSLTNQSMQWLSSRLSDVATHIGNAKPRYFDNSDKSLLKQLVPLIKQHGTEVKRNYLAMGSGFYEGANGKGKVPEVLRKIRSALSEAGLLTLKPEVDVFVNPSACQAVAESLSPMKAAGYRVRAASQNTDIFGGVVPRSLHAKLMISSNYRDGSPRCSNAWVYLGSGNLTSPGFTNAMSATLGNLEAGFMFSPEGLHWQDARDINDTQVVSNLLPIQWDTEIAEFEQLSSGKAMQENEEYPLAPPLAWLNWQAGVEGGDLSASEQIEYDVTPLDSNGNACINVQPGKWRWFGQPPRVVNIQWITSKGMQQAVIPVLDELGRLAATPLFELTLDEIWWQLANFPMATLDEDMSLEGDEINLANSDKSKISENNSGAAEYPIRKMMVLVEQIAAKQVELYQADWLAWCTRLEQSLLQIAKDPVIKVFRDMRLNPLSPLRQPAFLPVFAEQPSSPEGESYHALLTRIEKSWDVAHLCPIGEKL
jgi:hypothetical protein